MAPQLSEHFIRPCRDIPKDIFSHTDASQIATTFALTVVIVAFDVATIPPAIVPVSILLLG